MVEHDGMVGTLLKKLDDLGIADNTIVIYTTDNGAESFSWPDGGTTPFRSEKNRTGKAAIAFRPMVRWPGVTKPHTEINGIFAVGGLAALADGGGGRARHHEQAAARL